MSLSVHDILNEALDDEYKALATYRAVIEAFGPVRPFIRIVEAEERHAHALLGLYRQFGLVPPPDRWAGQVEPPGSVAEACAQGVAAEQENGRMYDRLLAQADHPAVDKVLRNLQRASQENHLPAFERCLERRRGDGRGPSAAGGGRRLRHRHRGGRG